MDAFLTSRAVGACRRAAVGLAALGLVMSIGVTKVDAVFRAENFDTAGSPDGATAAGANARNKIVRITGRSGTTYLAEIDSVGPRGQHTVECRPSDGLCLVLRRRMATPVLVAEHLLEPDSTASAPPRPVVEGA